MEVILTALAAGVGSSVASEALRVPTLRDAKLALVARKKSGSGNLDVKVQGSPNGEDWFDWLSFTQLVDASGSEEIPAPSVSWPFQRTIRTVGGTAVYDIWVFENGIYGGRRA